MNGSLQIKKTKAGNEYYYTVIELYDELGRRKPKWEATGLPVKGNKRKAEALLQKRIQECEGQINHTDSNLLFGDWIEQWLNSVKGQIEMSTWEGYYFPVQHVKKYFNAQKLKLNDLKPIHFDTYYTYMLTKGKCDGENPKGYAIKTVRQHKLVINLALQKAVYLEIISHNPADGIKVTNHKSKDLAKPIKFLSLKESQDLLAYLYDTGDELADVVKAVLFFGLRKSELLGIKEDAIDFKKKKLHISHTIVKVKTTYEKDRTKTSSSRRSYDLNDEMIDFLKKMVEKKRKNRLFYGNSYFESDYIFTWEDGHPYAPDFVYHHFKKVITKFGFPDMTFHDLRHSTASILYELGWEIKDIQEWLGHSDVQTTLNIYTHLSKAHKEEQAKSLEGIFTKSDDTVRTLVRTEAKMIEFPA